MRNPNAEIDVRGSFGESNFGDDLLMIVLDDFFHSIGQYANFKGRICDYPTRLLSYSGYNKPGNAHLLVYGGGTQFFSFSPQESLTVAKHLERSVRLLTHPVVLWRKIIEKYIRKPYKHVAFLGVGIGPFADQSSEDQSRSIFANSRFISVRDATSFDYCRRWKLHAIQGADIVLSSHFHKYLPASKKSTGHQEPNRKRKIGVIVRDWNWEKDGAAFESALLKSMAKSSDLIDFTFFIYAQDSDKQWIRKLSGQNPIIWNPLKHTVSDFISIHDEFDGFISSRYHGSVVACLLGKPVICIEIEDKLKILTEQLPGLKLWKKPFDEDELCQLILNLDYGVQYEPGLKTLASLSDGMMNEFARFLKEISG